MARSRQTGAWIGALLGLALAAQPASAQPGDDGLARIRLPGETQRLARRLADIQKLVEKQQWPEAVEEYQQVLEEAGDELVPISPRHLIQARRLCHLRIAALPLAGLRVYRARVDDQAKKWLEQGIANRDVRLLRRLADEAFCSRFADRALELLGDLAFESGRFEEAERWWRMLARPAVVQQQHDQAKGEKPSATDLLFPDPQVDLALVRAKQVLARLFKGEREGLARELESFRALHPKAEGVLAGRKGLYADTLHALLAKPGEWAPAAGGEPAWLTFAGAASRSLIAPQAPRFVSLDGPTWQVPLAENAANKEGLPQTPTAAALRLAWHPVIVGDQVLVADTQTVTAYHLLTGKVSGRFDLIEDLRLRLPNFDSRIAARSGARFTLTVAGDFVYARLGASLMSEPGEAETRDGKADTYLVCLHLRPDRAGKLVPRWRPVRARTQDTDPPALFEGAPLVRDGRVYIARLRFGVGTLTTSIDCYDAETGALRWRQDVCETSARKEGEPRHRHHLLTAAGPLVVYATHSGAIVALDSATGRRTWAVRYPSRGPLTADGDRSPRDLAPAVYSDGRLFVAPADLDRILCLDANSGQLVWESKSVEVVHLLGVAQGRLIFTTGSRPRGIRALEATTGNDLRSWVQPDDGNELPTLGRGLLAGDQVWWPTVNGLRLLDQREGEPLDIDPTRLRHIQPGNLAWSNGCLVVASEDRLYAYVMPARLLEQRKREADARPKDAAARYRLALAQEDAGFPDDARASFAAADRLAGSDQRLRDRMQAGRHELLLARAERARAERRGEEAAAILDQAAAEEFTVPRRLHALSRLAALWREAQQPDRAKAVLQALLAEKALAQGLVCDRNGVPHRAADWAADELARLSGQTIRPRPDPPDDADEPAGPPTVALPLLRTWHVPLSLAREGNAAAERLLPAEGSGQAKSEVLFFVHGNRLICREGETGKQRWIRELPGPPVWIGRHADRVLAADGSTISCLTLADGQLVWGFTAPSRGPHGIVLLSGFRLAAGRLFCFLAGRQLLALDVRDGYVLWGRWAPGGRIQPLEPGGRFHSGFHAGSRWVVVQSSAGQRWVLDARTGATVHESATGREPWPQPPLPLPDGRFCLVPDAQHVVLFDPATGKDIWRYTLDRSVSLTGAPPQVLAGPDTVLVLAARNYGHELQRLDVKTGKPAWKDALLISRQPCDLSRSALGKDVVYVVHDQALHAHSLADGKWLWEQPLGRGDWQAVSAGQYVIAHPQSVANHVRNLASRSGSTVALYDARDGQVVQCLNFPGEDLAVVVGPRGLAVAAGGMAWGLRTAPEK
jgi:outer membrane protein assembly factor BamB